MNVHRLWVHATGSRKLALLMGLLGVFLLFAQLGALAHAYSHDRAAGFAAIHSAETPCAECPSFAPLLGGAPPSPALLHSASPAPVLVREETTSSFRDSSPILAFRSRAPPTA
jgi:hypothetical protein